MRCRLIRRTRVYICGKACCLLRRSSATSNREQCYCVAGRTPETPAAVFLRFGNDTVTVPVTLQATGTADGTRSLVGSGATAFTLARISVTGGQLSDVVFNEATPVGSPARPVSRMTGSLKTVVPVAPRAPAPVLPG